MNYTEKKYLQHNIDQLSVRMLTIPQFEEAIKSFKYGMYETYELNLSLVYISRKEYVQPLIIDGARVYEYSNKRIYYYKKMVKRVSKQTISGTRTFQKHSVGGTTTTAKALYIYDIGLLAKGVNMTRDDDWDLQFIRQLNSQDYGVDWWICHA